MLKLDAHLTLDAATVDSRNLCDRFEKKDLDSIGAWCLAGYKQDKASRAKWEQRTEAAMDLAMQIQQAKNFPWPNCSNVAFPLVTIATMQFHASAYPAIVRGTQVVKMRVVSSGTQEDYARAIRVGRHMSWQCLEQDEDWEEQHDRLLINVSVVGTAFKKSYFNSTKGYNDSDLVLAKDLVLDYYAKSVEECPRKTHIVPMFRNEIYERVQRGTFRDILEEAWYKREAPLPQTTTQSAAADNRAGLTPPGTTDETTPFIFGEQHSSLDLDGDGYAEPYIITFDLVTGCVTRIVTRFDSLDAVEQTAAGKVISIKPLEYFTKYPFIPSPDGSIYDIGFGVLLGPLNESVDSLINQLIDAGTMSIAAGGFLGRGAKIRGGVYSFAPFEWKRVDSSGDDLRKQLVPLPVREPSAVLFQLLSLLINYVNRVSGSTDMMVGENPGQNTPAQTSQEMVRQGMKIYSGIFKRIWRSMKEEFRKLYLLNALHLPPTQAFGEAGQKISRQDYLGDPSKVVPAADPHIISDEARLKKALTLREMSRTASGYNVELIERMVLDAMDVEGVEQIYPGVGDPKEGKVPALPNPKMEIEKAKLAIKEKELQFEQIKFVTEMQEEKRLNDASIQETEANVASLINEIGADRAAKQVEMFGKHVEMLKSRNDVLIKQMDLMRQRMQLAQTAQEHRQELIHNEGRHLQSLVHTEQKHQQALQQQREKAKENENGE